jgi:hypothetical protein
MLESFCVAANVKTFLRRPDCPSTLRECQAILEQCWSGQDGMDGAFAKELRMLIPDEIPGRKDHDAFAWGKQRPLSKAVLAALASIDEELSTMIENWSRPNSVFYYEEHTIRGVRYTTRARSRRDSAVFFKPRASEHIVPGIIQEIFSVPIRHPQQSNATYSEEYFLVIQRHIATWRTDPFRKYQDFGASIWSNKLATELDVVLATTRICHSISRPWGEDAVVLKALDRVSFTPHDEGRALTR